MKTPSLLVACCLVLFSTLLLRASAADRLPLGAERRTPSTESELDARRCGGEPCDAVHAACARSSTGRWTVWTGTGAPAPTATCRRTTSSSRPADAEARFQFLQWRRQRNPDADDPLFRPIDADDFRTNGDERQRLQQPSPERPGPDHVPAAAEHQADRSGDQRAVDRDVRGRVAHRADGQRRGADRPGRRQSVAARPEPVRRISAGRAASTTLQEQALGALTNHAQIQNAPPQRLLDDLSSFQRMLFTNHRVRALADAVREGTTPLAGSRSAARRARAAGQGGVRARLRPVPRRPRTVDPAGPGGSIPRHLEPVSASGRHRDAGALRVRAVPAATRPQRPDLRDHAGRTARKIRRTSSDPGRALLTGFVGGRPAQDDWNKFDVPGLRGLRKTAPYFHNNSAATLEEVVDHYMEFFKRVQANAAPGVVPPIAEHRRRALRSPADARGARAAPGLPAKAIGLRREGATLGGNPVRARFNPTVVDDPTAGTGRAPRER